MNKLLVFGDSMAYGKWDPEGGWVQRLRKFIDEKYNINKTGAVLVYNLGIPSELAINMVNRVQSELDARVSGPEDEATVIFSTGLNDSCPNNRFSEKQTPEVDFKQAMSKMIEMALSKQCKVFVLGLTPSNPARSKGLLFTNEEIKRYDQFISEVCNEKKVEKIAIFDELMKQNYPDLLVDSVHPNATGHQMIFEIVSKVVN